jgi:hypothetical protein
LKHFSEIQKVNSFLQNVSQLFFHYLFTSEQKVIKFQTEFQNINLNFQDYFNVVSHGIIQHQKVFQQSLTNFNANSIKILKNQ